ncbi:hypothetical protein ACFSC4_27130 [Deinococcus malanensis]|nr:hypothetical protein [Deinococcus malanensis]
MLLLLSVLLIMLGLPALLTRQGERATRVGAAGLVMVFLGLASMDVLHSVLDISALPALMSDPATHHLVSEQGTFGQALSKTPYMALTMIGGPPLLLGLPVLGWSLWHTLPNRLLAVPLFVTSVLLIAGFAVLPLLSLGQGTLYVTLEMLGLTLLQVPHDAASTLAVGSPA